MANDTAMNMDRPGTGAELKVRPGDRCLICFFPLSLPFSLVLENRRLLGPVVAERQGVWERDGKGRLRKQ